MASLGRGRHGSLPQMQMRAPAWSSAEARPLRISTLVTAAAIVGAAVPSIAVQETFRAGVVLLTSDDSAAPAAASNAKLPKRAKLVVAPYATPKGGGAGMQYTF